MYIQLQKMQLKKDCNTHTEIEKIRKEHLENLISLNLSKNDKYIITSSMPSHWKGHTNMMKVNQVSL